MPLTRYRVLSVGCGLQDASHVEVRVIVYDPVVGDGRGQHRTFLLDPTGKTEAGLLAELDRVISACVAGAPVEGLRVQVGVERAVL